MISGIRLPSGSELTTRCPIELILRKSNDVEFQARVSILVPGGTPTEAPFSIKDQVDLEERIRQAQAQIVAGLGTTRVSKSSIVVEVEGCLVRPSVRPSVSSHRHSPFNVDDRCKATKFVNHRFAWNSQRCRVLIDD